MRMVESIASTVPDNPARDEAPLSPLCSWTSHTPSAPARRGRCATSDFNDLDAARNRRPFPGVPGRRVRESERAVIWEYVSEPGPSPSPHHDLRDAVVVAFVNRKPRVSFVPRGTVHNDEETAGASRA